MSSVTQDPASIRDLAQLRDRLRAFAAARDWDQFHSPKNLATALVVEAAEVVEHFQWLTEDQSRSLDAATKQAVAAELADVLAYLVRLADQLGIDLLAAASAKLAQNELRYPAERARGSARKYTAYAAADADGADGADEDAIVPATVEDLPAIVALLGDTGLPAQDVASHLPCFVVARARTRVVGTAGLEIYGAHGLLRSVAVAPSWRGKGLGEAMVHAIVRLARERGLSHLYLLTETADAYFHRLGFALTERAAMPQEMQAAPQLAGLCPASAKAMVLPL